LAVVADEPQYTSTARRTVMVRIVSIQEASAHLAELVQALAPGDQIVLTDGARRLGRIVPEPAAHPHRKAGVCKGMLEILDDDDEVVLDHFRDYVP
jgi:antitoxin (DNA-binding transcriptional repressor) of toxin-antitoxin stability system